MPEPTTSASRTCDRQFMVTALAMAGQWMVDVPGRLQSPLERAALAVNLATRGLAGPVTKRTGLLGQANERRRFARIPAIHAQLRLQRFHSREQCHDEIVLVRFGQSREIGGAFGFRWHT